MCEQIKLGQEVVAHNNTTDIHLYIVNILHNNFLYQIKKQNYQASYSSLAQSMTTEIK